MNSFNTWSGRKVVAASALGGSLLTLGFFFPRFWLWPVAGLPLTELIAIQPEIHRAFHALHQLQDPWQRIDDPVNRVIEWRLLWPIIGHTIGLSPRVYLALPHLGCLAALATTAAIIWRVTKDALPTATGTLLAATASWFFVSTGWLAYFDSWLMLTLLLASFGRSGWTLFGTALLAPWIDERFILALPLCLAVRALAADRETPLDRRELTRAGLLLLAGVLPYIAVRFGAEWNGTRATSHSYWSDRPFMPAPLHAMIWGTWNGPRLGWVLAGFGAVAAFSGRRHRIAVTTIFLTLIVNLLVADDVSRSASILLPAVIAAVLLGWRYHAARCSRVLPLLCLGNLVLPAQHIIAAPGTSVAWHAVPILSLDAELDRAKNPPDFAHAANYTRRSMDHLQNRENERALIAAEMAVRFYPHSAKAGANRGIILYVTGRKAEGAAELDRALLVAPELYDARMQRAAFRQQSGDLPGALEDVREALRFMPPDWPRRSEAQQFERALAAQTRR